MIFIFFLIKDGKLKYSVLNYSMIIFFIYSILSLFYSYSPWSSRNEINRLFYYFAFFFLLVNTINYSQVKILLNIIIISTFFVSIYGLTIYSLVGDPNYLIFSTFFNPNCLATYLIIALPLIIYQINTSENKMTKTRFILILIAVSLCLFLTGSRGAFISFIVSYLIVIFLFREKIVLNRQKIFLLSIFIILFLGLFFTKPILQKKIFSFFDTQHRSHLFRVLVWEGSLNIIKEHPLYGVGIGSFESVYPNFKLGGVNTKLVHNTYLQKLVEGGVVGFFLFIFIIISYLLIVFSGRSGGEVDRLTKYLLWSSLCFLIHNLFDYPWYVPANALLFFSISAMNLLCLKNIKTVTFKNSFNIFNILLFLTLIPIVIYISVFNIRMGFAAFFAERGEDFLENKKIKYAEIELRKATTLDKKAPEYHKNLGMVFRKKNELRKAGKEFKKAISLEPHSAFYHTDLGMVYKDLGEREKAKKEFKIATSLHKTYTIPIRELGIIYLKDGKFDLAEKEFEKILKISENPYESEKYKPIEGQKENEDFNFAKEMLLSIRNLKKYMK